ncbi:MAG: class I SAM-dependent methyltransferase [Hyphomicrobium sp.]
MREIEASGRPATQGEQRHLARYVGWGGIKGVFHDADGNYGKGLEKVGAELKELLPETEYATARRSLQYAHFTAENVVNTMWEAVRRMGFEGGKVFEPGMGVGNFAGLMPADIAVHTDYSGLELDHTTARIARLLYPKWGVRQDDFTRSPLPEDTFDVVIGNPPFADVAIKSDPKYPQGFLLHDYFFAKSLDSVRPGGILAFISSAGTMNKHDTRARQYFADRADLVGAIRLPGNAFKKNAGTEVTTDILFLRKRLPDE